jgi:hypothetical protein
MLPINAFERFYRTDIACPVRGSPPEVLLAVTKCRHL